MTTRRPRSQRQRAKQQEWRRKGNDVTGRPGQAQPDVWPATERTSGPVQRGRRAPLDGSVSRPPATHPRSEAAHGPVI
jgi:hypothetical protein